MEMDLAREAVYDTIYFVYLPKLTGLDFMQLSWVNQSVFSSSLSTDW